MTVTLEKVKELRELSGAGMMDAKNALVKTDGDIEAAMDYLRTKGLAKAAKKAGRVTAEGLVGIAIQGGTAVAVEINSETDFVSKNESFQDLVLKITQTALGVSDLEALKETTLDGKKISDFMTDSISRIGENLTLRRMQTLKGDSIAGYIHAAASENLGRIAVLVAFKGQDQGVGKKIAMHIAASSPRSLSEKDLDPTLVERERAIFTEQARESGKPDNVIEKMIEGRIRKFYEEVTLLSQSFVMNPDQKISDVLREAGLEITGFIRMEIGEGIEKREENFAEEVAKTLNA